MRAVGLDYDRRTLESRDVPDPRLRGHEDVVFRIYEVGICGTDRDLARFRFGYPPVGETFLTLGHEALGQVVETGAHVTRLRQDDWVIPIVRRPCPGCRACASNRRDLCVSGKYTERGIMGAHGYFSEFAVDHESDLLLIPPALVPVAVLVEPLSVVEKAVEVGLAHHALGARNAVVIGAGPIGLLAALVLRLRGLDVTVQSLEPPGSARARLVEGAGARYSNEPAPKADLVIEAAGSTSAAVAGFHALAASGVLVVLGAATYPDFPLRQLIVGNQVVVGSVNAGPASFGQAVEDLREFDRGVLEAMIHRRPFSGIAESILGPLPPEAKTVHVLR